MYLPDESLLAKYAIKTHYIMKVVAVHPETQTVDLVEDVYRFTNSLMPFTTVVNELGNAVDVALAKKMQLLNIPVKQERWGQFKIQCNPAVGDTGYIEIMTNDIRDWLINGSDSVPLSDSHFDERSCVFVPFVQNATNSQKGYPQDNTQLVIKSDHLSITLTDEADPEAGSPDEPVRNISVVGDVNVNGNITATGDITIDGDITVDGDITTTGDVSITGDITVTGEIEASGDIKSTEGDVVAGTVSLKNHTHNFVYSAGEAVGTAGVTQGANK